MTQDEAVKELNKLIDIITRSGYSVFIENECCGCSRMDLMVYDKSGDNGMRVDV